MNKFILLMMTIDDMAFKAEPTLVCGEIQWKVDFRHKDGGWVWDTAGYGNSFEKAVADLLEETKPQIEKRIAELITDGYHELTQVGQ